MSDLQPSEALYAFAGWITSRDERVCASSTDDAAVWAKLVEAFCKQNNLAEPRKSYKCSYPPR